MQMIIINYVMAYKLILQQPYSHKTEIWNIETETRHPADLLCVAKTVH